MDCEARINPADLCNRRTGIGRAIVDVIMDEDNVASLGGAKHVCCLADSQSERTFTLRIQFFEWTDNTGQVDGCGAGHQLDIGAVSGPPMAEHHETDARLFRQSRQRLAKRVAREHELGLLFAERFAPHGARTVEDDHSIRWVCR